MVACGSGDGAYQLSVFGSSRRRHTRYWRDWSSDVCSSDLLVGEFRVHFEHGARSLAASAGIAEAGIEESRIVHAEFADQGIERHHFGGVIRRHLHGLLRGQDVELAGIEDEAAVRTRRDRLPEFIDRIAGAAVDIDHAGVALGAVANETIGFLAGEIDR